MNSEWVPIIATFVATVLVLGAGGIWFHELVTRPREERRRRMDRATVSSTNKELVQQNFDQLFEDAIRQGPVTTTSWNPIVWYDRLIVESGFPISSPVTLLILCFLSLSAGLVCEWYFELLPATLAVAAAVVILPLPFFMFFRTRRKRTILLQLPELFELLARALRAGRSLPDAIGLAADVAPSPCNAEFSRCHRQLNLGLSFGVAAQNLARRINLFDMDLFLTTVLVHHGGGGNLPEALDRLSGMSRDRQHFRGHLLAVTAQQRLSTIMLLFLAPIVVGALIYINPEYLKLLFTTSLGHKMLAAATVLQIVGLIWVSRLLRVQY